MVTSSSSPSTAGRGLPQVKWWPQGQGIKTSSSANLQSCSGPGNSSWTGQVQRALGGETAGEVRRPSLSRLNRARAQAGPGPARQKGPIAIRLREVFSGEGDSSLRLAVMVTQPDKLPESN